MIFSNFRNNYFKSESLSENTNTIFNNICEFTFIQSKYLRVGNFNILPHSILDHIIVIIPIGKFSCFVIISLNKTFSSKHEMIILEHEAYENVILKIYFQNFQLFHDNRLQDVNEKIEGNRNPN